MSDRAGGLLLVAGSLVFLIGAAIGVPRVFMESDAAERLRLLEGRLRDWQLAQPLYAFGPIVCGIGVGVLASGWMLVVSCVMLVVGAVAWAWFVYLRGRRVRDFAHGRLPRWPFPTYVLLTIAGIALLGAGFLVGEFAHWLGWLTLGADAAFLAGYAYSGDIPPFVFYLLFLTVGLAVL